MTTIRNPYTVKFSGVAWLSWICERLDHSILRLQPPAKPALQWPSEEHPSPKRLSALLSLVVFSASTLHHYLGTISVALIFKKAWRI